MFKNRLSKIAIISIMSSFLIGCGIGGQDANNSQNGDDQDPQEVAEEYAGMSEADFQYAVQQAKEFKFDQAALGFAAAAKEFTVSKYYSLVYAGKSSYRLNINQDVGSKTMANFLAKARRQAPDYYQGKVVQVGSMVIAYPQIVAKSLNINDSSLQRLVSTVQLHESANNPQLSILCNYNGTVDFGMGQVNAVSWQSKQLCYGMVDDALIRTANNLCKQYGFGNKTNALIRQTLINMIAGKSLDSVIKSYSDVTNQDIIKAVANKKSPFNPITNTTCSYKHLQYDLVTAQRLYKTCDQLREGSKTRFTCPGSKPTEFDYWAIALVNYGGNTKKVLYTGRRFGSTIDDYINEFRSAYVVLYGDRPPF
jgi:hypothetical protein